MKNRICLLALSLMMVSGAAFAQRNDNNNDYHNRDRYTDNRNNGYNDPTDYGPRRVRYNDNRNAMRPAAFRIIFNNIRSESFDRDKLRAARYVVQQNNLSVAQIKTLAELFSFDAYKLEFTKSAYASCVDPQNYYTLSNVFAFSSSKRALFDYIARV